MNPFRRIVTTLAATLALAGTSHAANLFAAPAVSSSGLWTPETTFCTLLNTRTYPVTVTIKTHNHLGAVIDDSGPITVLPDAGTWLAASDKANYCEFIVDGSTKSVRAMAVARSNTTNLYTIAVPAQ